MRDDPYQVPEEAQNPPERECVTDARLIVREWERLRLFYNGALGIFGLAVLLHLSAVPYISPLMLAVGAVMVAVGANACFCLGSLWEIYSCVLRDIRAFSPKPRLIVFITGLCLSLFLFAVIGWWDV